MTLTEGSKLGPYEIVAPIGAGGMGEVYRAKDQKLGRDVAIKVLPEEFAKDADRTARFQREAKLLASLNHPNIAAIYGLEEFGGTNFLVLELVEGKTLAEQMKRGPIPVEESLKLALQIAEALEAAHEKGVIHRDLKPANIKVTPEGKVKILDFGLAKVFAGEQAELNLSNSPTLSHAATQQGVILGTAGYMSPEQARGESVDKRADIWAFGCVLFEMLTGCETFEGRTVSDILASVLKSEPAWDRLPPNLHPRIRLLLERCLEKDVNNRYGVIGDARVDIQAVLEDPSHIFQKPVSMPEKRTWLRHVHPWVAAAVVLTAIVAGVAVWKLKPLAPGQVIRFSYELPKDQQFLSLADGALAVSPDGRQIVYSTASGLYLRSVDELEAKLISGTGGAYSPFFSPDGKWIGYYDGQLKKISTSGGAPLTLTDSNAPIGSLWWGSDDKIVFGRIGGGLMRVSANGGTPEIIDKRAELSRHPQILPDGKSVLFTVYTSPRKIVVQSLQTGERKELFEGEDARYLPTGHILYGLGNNLLAVPFDLKTLKVLGGPVSVIEGVVHSIRTRQYAVSESGLLAYVPGGDLASASPHRTLVWVGRNGKEEPLAAPINGYKEPKVSPDGTKIALAVASGSTDVWIWDIARKTLPRLTFDRDLDVAPLWTLDGKRIAYQLRHGGIYEVFWKSADGTGKDESLGSSSGLTTLPATWSGDGKTLVAQSISGIIATDFHFDIVALALEGERKWRPLLKEKYSQGQPRVSPDGRWLAYISNESGKYEVYVRPFPDVDKGHWQISTAGGDSPLWSPDGHELFYRSGDAVMAVSVKTDPAFSWEGPRELFHGTYVSAGLGPSSVEMRSWDISPDGKRFLMMKDAVSNAAESELPRRINIVMNWFEELKLRVPAGSK